MMKFLVLIGALLSSAMPLATALDACSECIRTGATRMVQNSLRGLQQMCSTNNTCATTRAHCEFIQTHPQFVLGYFVGSSLPLGQAASFCSLTGQCHAVNRTEIIANLLNQTDIDHQAYDIIHTSALLDLWPSTSACSKPMLFENGNRFDNTDNDAGLVSSTTSDLGNMGAAPEAYKPREIKCIQCTKRGIVNTLAASQKYLGKVCASHEGDGYFWAARCKYVNNAASSQVIEGYLTGHFHPTNFAVGSCLGTGECRSVNDLANWHPVQPFAVRLGFAGYF